MPLRRDTPFVNLVVGEGGAEDTFVHIRQLVYADERAPTTPSESQDGVRMPLDQFRSLMYHLRALDAQFKGEVASTSKRVKDSAGEVPPSFAAGREDKIATKVSIIDQGYEQQPHAEEPYDDDGEAKNVTGDVAMAGQKRPWYEIGSELDNLIANMVPADATTLSAPVAPTYVPTTTTTSTPRGKAMPTAVPSVNDVRDYLAVLYAEELITALPQIVRENCMGCALGYDKNTAVYEHDVCHMSRKKRIEQFARQILITVDESAIGDKLTARMHSHHMLHDAAKMYIDKNTLLVNPKWLNKMKSKAANM